MLFSSGSDGWCPLPDSVLNPTETPHWERGYRCHGYWIQVTQWGRVYLLGPHGTTLASKDGYGWSFSPPGGKYQEGRCKTLREGKLIVEGHFKEHARERNFRADGRQGEAVPGRQKGRKRPKRSPRRPAKGH